MSEADEGHVLFAYGSLRLPALQQWLFDRQPNADADVLDGARCRWIDDPDPDLLRLTGQRGYPALWLTGTSADRVTGSRLVLSETELLRADDYEGSGYLRQRVPLRSGHRAWIYVDVDSGRYTTKNPARRQPDGGV